jgi:hypothetical protein
MSRLARLVLSASSRPEARGVDHTRRLIPLKLDLRQLVDAVSVPRRAQLEEELGGGGADSICGSH